MVTKITWQKAGLVTEPGQYMFRFGWLNDRGGRSCDLASNFRMRRLRWSKMPAATGRHGGISSRRVRSAGAIRCRTLVMIAHSLVGLHIGFRRCRIDGARRGQRAARGSLFRPRRRRPTAGDHGRSIPLGLTASTANPSRLRRSAIAPCRRSRSRPMTEAAQDAGGCRAVTTSAARSQSSASASGRSASATNPPPAASVTQPVSSHETPSASEASVARRASASAASHSFTRNASLAGAHQMQPSIPAADADIAAVGGDQDIRLRHPTAHTTATTSTRRPTSAAASAAARTG